MLFHPEIMLVKHLNSVQKFQRAKEKQIYIGWGGGHDRVIGRRSFVSSSACRQRQGRPERHTGAAHHPEPFALSQQMISKHIAYLVRARMVIKTKRGRESVCTLRPEAIKTVSDWAISYRRFWEESFDKLDVVVNRMKKEEVRDDR
jgi:hypothetical protein